MSFDIRVNGQPFALWESATVQRSIDSNAGVFRFTNSSTTPISGYPVHVGDFVEILIQGEQKVAGYVDETTGSQDAGTHTIDVSGRDNIQDLIDSSVPDAAKITAGPVALAQLCRQVITAIGADIGVVERVPDVAEFTADDLQAAASGETCMAYLVAFARKRQVYLVPDGGGNLVIYRPSLSDKASGVIIHKVGNRTNNVISYTVRRSHAQRYNTYLCRSQDNFGFDPFADYSGSGTDRNSGATDSEIRATRYLEVQAEESMSTTECGGRAAEESNIRRALGMEYTVTVAGNTQTDGTLWDFGQFVNIIDDYADISGNYLIKTVEYAIDIRKGTRTRLVCVPPDAYQVTAEPTRASKRSARTGR